MSSNTLSKQEDVYSLVGVKPEVELVSLDAPIKMADGGTKTLHDIIPSYDALVVEEADIRKKILSAFNRVSLTHKEFMVVCKRFLQHEPATLRDIGKELGVSREHIRRVQNRALKKIRRYFEDHGYGFENMGLVA